MKPIKNGQRITKVDCGDLDPSLYPMDGCILSEVDWGAHDSSFFLYLVHIDLDANQRIPSPMDCGEDYHKGDHHQYVKGSFDTGQI